MKKTKVLNLIICTRGCKDKLTRKDVLLLEKLAKAAYKEYNKKIKSGRGKERKGGK